ncbi:MAG: LysM repeat protein [Akkermansiaceae bacterium]|jgi:LysM repeat protein
MIKRGDTLWGLSRRYGVSVTAIQKANRISGTNIRAGKTILIPK